MSTYTVRKAEKIKDVQLDHGMFQSVSLALSDGTQEILAEWLTKDTTVLPSPGATLDGTLEDGKYGKKFKKTQAGGFGGGGRGRSPEETKAIVRQHSQEMALRYAAIRAQQGKLPEDFKLSDLSKIVDYFVKDAAS